ncbi:MAG: hypothetical protein M3444_19470, partial [Acidobacteriota bacterium]|nr:hypothetical protein [Acidobacteriota bacterium]
MGLSNTRRRVERRTALLKGSLALAACVLAAGSAGVIRPASPSDAVADARGVDTRATFGDIDTCDAADRAQHSWLGVEAFATLLFTQADSGATIRTDRRVYAQTPLAEPTTAGQTYRDPTFGTQIMRVTDASNCPAPGCGTWYSNWPTFNADDTRILIRLGESGDVIIRAFDPVNFKLGPVLRTTPRLSGTTPNWQSATWSRTDPDLLYLPGDYYNASYTASGMKLYTYRPSTDTFKLVKDFAPALSAAGLPDYFFEMHADAKEDLFVFSRFRVG